MKRKIKKLNILFYNLFLNFYFIIILKKSIVLSSISKSGTQYLRLIVSNYLININEKNYKKKNYFEISSQYFPNIRSRIIYGKSKYNKNFLGTTKKFKKKYSDFMYDHGCFFENMFFFKPKKVIYLYRNPLDYLISHFNYKKLKNSKIKHPREIIKTRLPEYIQFYKKIKKCENKKGFLIINYENLILETDNTLKSIIKFLEIEFDKELLSKIIIDNSIENIKKIEEDNKQNIHFNKNIKYDKNKSFIASGKIGQWKKYFKYNDIKYIKNFLENEQIFLEEFILGYGSGGGI